MDTLGSLMLSARQGDVAAAYALHDYCEERGLKMLEVGKQYLIRTLNFTYTGEVIECNPMFTRLKDAAWIADTGRFSEALAKGTLSEVEPYPDEVIINTQNISDAAEWRHKLPRATN